jgi:ABC-2 type transport system ATP-binding protein
MNHPMNAALLVDRLTKRYGAQTAVNDLSFSVEPGGITGFLGPNGAGKTSTIRMILGLIAPTAGRITVLGADDVRTVQDRIGFLPEERGLYKRMTPIDAVAFLASLKGVPTAEGRRRALTMLEAQGLGGHLKKPIKSLSKGMAQKVQLVAAVAHHPDLVILDEPFSGLDPVNQQALEEVIRGIAARGATVLFSTHVMQHAERLCDRVVLLAKGRKAFDGTVSEARSAAPRVLTLEGSLDAASLARLPGVSAIEPAPPAERGGPPRLTAVIAPGAPVQDLLRAVFAQGVEVTRFEMKEPSLHDAFIVLTGQSLPAPDQNAVLERAA